MSENEMILAGGADLVKQSELYEPMLYYGSKARITVDYVSDIHLLHHAPYFNYDIQKTIRAIAKSLYESMSFGRWGGTTVQAFLGDISSDGRVTVAFYKQYRMQDMYRQYKRFKRSLRSESDIQQLERRHIEIEKRYDRLSCFIDSKEVMIRALKSEIDEYVSYSKVIAPKGRLEDIKKYLASNYYKKREVPDAVTEKILLVSAVQDKVSDLQRKLLRLEQGINAEYDYDIVRLADFHYEQPSILGVVILGNHEYIGFYDVDDAVKFYKKELEPLGYRVLQNESLENDQVVIYAGSGFAKYSEQFNANNIVCCDAMMGNRDYEIAQTAVFEQEYEAARQHAKDTGKCFICLTHYPVESCLSKFDKDTVYFSGHTHRNERYKTEDRVLYADNQVGYHKNGGFDGVVRFKRATTDPARNPYADFEDGYQQTTPDAYLQFYDYIGESVGEGKLIRKRCETGELYVIKSRGYYGFFVVNNSGISIVNGGKTKKIALSKNIEWIYDNFNIVVSKYLAVLEPLRAAQLQISRELKRLGFYGTIHGLIVDVDFYNHIMVNPIDGTITFYYSPEFGQVRPFESFQKQLAFMGCAGLLESKVTDSQRNEIALYGSNMLAAVENNYVMSEMATVSRRTGVYGVSRAVNPLQRLFTGHVLRDFDLRLIEVEDDSATHRALSMRGRVYMDRDFNEYLVIRDDLGEFLTLIDCQGSESVTTIQKVRSSMTGKSYERARWNTFSIEATVAEYGENLPESWREAIQQMSPRVLENKK